MQIVSRGTVFQAERGTDHQSCAFPGVCVLPSGRWLCGCRAAPAKSATTGQHVLLAWSDDQGTSWSKPEAPFTPPHLEKPGLFRAVQLTALAGNRVLAVLYWLDYSNPALPFFNKETEGLLDSRIFLSESRDSDLTWSEPKPVDTSPFHAPTPITGPILLLPDRRWACQFELNKHYYDTSVWRHSSVLIFSSNEGRTWPTETEQTIYRRGRTGSQTRQKSTMQDAWAEMAKFSIGLPHTAVLPDGDVLVVYYAGSETDLTDIEWARLRF